MNNLFRQTPTYIQGQVRTPYLFTLGYWYSEDVNYSYFLFVMNYFVGYEL